MAQPPLFRLDKPDSTDIKLSKIYGALDHDSLDYRKIVQSANEPRYIYWDEFRHKAQSGPLSAEEQWYLIRQIRNVASAETVIKNKDGENFRWLRQPSLDEHLHKIDMLVRGNLFPKSHIPTGSRETYIQRGVLEEAIASSQLEGAHVTRAVAKKLLLEKRKPQNTSEQMIVNNYQAMVALEEKFKDVPLTRDMLFELHSMLTKNTIDRSEQKRFRKNDDEIVVQGTIGFETYTTHIPPSEEFLSSEIPRLIEYANDTLEKKFVHPIIKAIFLHFWIGYLHPFTDGNGRLARALFYWYLLKNGYWTFTYIPISIVIKKSNIQYPMAYIYTEQDNNDLTYFFDYHLRKINQAIIEFENYVAEQVNQNKHVDEILDKNITLNERQKQLIHYFSSDEKASTTITAHAAFKNISRQTAATDLRELEELGFVESTRAGKSIQFKPTPKLLELYKK